MRLYRAAALTYRFAAISWGARIAADVSGLLFTQLPHFRRMSAARGVKSGGAGTGSVSKLPDFQMSRLRALNSVKVRALCGRG